MIFLLKNMKFANINGQWQNIFFNRLIFKIWICYIKSNVLGETSIEPCNISAYVSAQTEHKSTNEIYSLPSDAMFIMCILTLYLQASSVLSFLRIPLYEFFIGKLHFL